MSFDVKGKVTREVLYNTEVKKLEESMKRPIRSVSLKEIVNLNASLIQVKVMDLVLEGADMVPVDYRKLANVVPLDTPQLVYPTISHTDFKVVKGSSAAAKRYMGGKAGAVSFDCAGDKGLYTMALGVKKTDIRDQNWGIIEETVRMAGKAFSKYVCDAIIEAYVADAGNTQARSTDNHFDALNKLVALCKNDGFYPNFFLIAPDEHTDLMALANFTSSLYTANLNIQINKGLIGTLYGAPVYVVYNATLATNMVAAEFEKGKLLGLREDLMVEDYDDPLHGLEGAILSMRYDLKTGFANAIGKVTGA